MPGSGKSTIVSALKTKGFEALNLGDGVRAEAKRRNLEPVSYTHLTLPTNREV